MLPRKMAQYNAIFSEFLVYVDIIFVLKVLKMYIFYIKIIILQVHVRLPRGFRGKFYKIINIKIVRFDYILSVKCFKILISI